MSRKKNTPRERAFALAEVRATVRVSPHMIRMTLGGLDAFTPLGSDHWCRLFFSRDGQDSLQLPTRTSEVGWYLQYLATPKTRRPWVRAYTVRAARPEVGEVDIDFVIHADAAGNLGPAAALATKAKPGDVVGVLDQGKAFSPDHPHDWTLLVADETAMPAVIGISEGLPADRRGIAIIEVPTAADRQQIRAPAGIDVVWVHRDETAYATGTPGRAALEVLTSLAFPQGEVHAHLIGESALATGARRHLVNERGVPKRNVDFAGYWRHGRAATG